MDNSPKPSMFSLKALHSAWTYARDGLRHGLARERAIRQEIIALCVLAPLALCLPVNMSLRIALVGTMIIVLIVEFLNTAIEKTVDYISMNQHPQAKIIKDLSSAAVFLSFLHSGLWWVWALWLSSQQI